EQVASGPELHAMEALMKVTLRLAPQQLFRLQVVPPGDRVGHAVERRVSQDKEVIAIYLEVIEPGILREAVQLLPWPEATFRGWFVDVQGLAATNEQPPGKIHRLADEELLFITVEKLNDQRFVGQVNTGHLGCCNAGEQAKRKII
ncbi:MAG: hypothetical protein HOK49_00990, partial [Opitutae bacterium]|nr:hypothetical protein [Opitutae bacterium]MBT6461089.1 hypothetical protein [Opitutae bacterium]